MRQKQFFWVNHKQTFEQELKGGYIWSPKRNVNGSFNQTYENLTKVNVGDIIFSYASFIRAIGTVKEPAKSSQKPTEFGSTGDVWSDDGWKVKVDFQTIQTPIKPKDHIEKIASLLPEKYSPIQKNGNGNQGCYLAKISPELGTLLLTLTDTEYVTKDLISDELIEIKEDILSIENSNTISATEKSILTQARLGQGDFRKNLIKLNPKCRVTNISMLELLRASHIKPWRSSNNEERLDPYNGLLLAAHIDLLFDQGWISFSDTGDILMSPQLSSEIFIQLGITKRNVGVFSERTKSYLTWHRKNIFKSEP